MTTWLVDTALLKASGTPSAPRLQHWIEANDASLFLSAATLTEIAAAISKASVNQPQRSAAMRKLFEGITEQFVDRIHPVDSEVALRAGSILSGLRNGLPRYRLHDAILVATAQARGHCLLTRRDALFGPWTNIAIPTALEANGNDRPFSDIAC